MNWNEAIAEVAAINADRRASKPEADEPWSLDHLKDRETAIECARKFVEREKALAEAMTTAEADVLKAWKAAGLNPAGSTRFLYAVGGRARELCGIGVHDDDLLRFNGAIYFAEALVALADENARLARKDRSE